MRCIDFGGALIAASIGFLSATGRGQVVPASPPPSSVRSTTSTQQANADVFGRRIALRLDHVTLAMALDTIASHGRVRVVYSWSVVPVDRTVSLVADGITIGEALTLLLRGTRVKAVVTTSETVMLVNGEDIRSDASSADTGGYAMVVVHVTDDTTTRPLVGAVVGVKGTRLQSTTTETGYALLRRVPSGPVVVFARYLGYTPEERSVIVPDTGYVTVNVPLRMGMAHLQEIVTTATGPRRRYELPNDVTILNVDSLVATQPISSVTQILEGRVPGLTVQHTSGAPGDPSRLRLRGTSSVLRSNDPIVILDGIRVYAAQSDSQSGNIAAGRLNDTEGSGLQYAAPSPLDQIDPGSIETIEVLKGPSAATLYGPDAANGVIVITTKRGKPGPGRWTLSAERGMSNMPGNYPLGYYRWGTDYIGNTVLCPLTQFNCTADSLVLFQALNHRQYTILKGGGVTSDIGLDVSGGSEALTYDINGSIDDENGMTGLPPVEIAHFQSIHNGADPFSWMKRPDHLSRWAATTRLMAKLSDKAEASVSVSLTRETQQRSDLDRELASLMTTYIDPKSGTYWQAGGGINQISDLLPNFYHRVTDDETNVRNGANLSWRPLGWLNTSADLGINVISKGDDDLLPAGMLPAADTAGSLSTARFTVFVTTLNLGSSARVPLPWGIHLQLSGGANLTKTTTGGLLTGARGLAPGTSSLVGAQKIEFDTQTSTEQTSYGWYVEPDVTFGHFAISPGVRLDQSSTFGKNARQPLFPKVGISWLVSEEPFFPLRKIFDTFRTRAAYGEAGVWPGPTDQLRLYQSSTPWLDGGFQPATQIYQLGNTRLRPERSTEIEAGFEADLFHDWISVSSSAYRKMRYDAILPVPVAPSVYGTLATVNENIGVIRNTGIEGTLSTQLLRTDPVSWSVAVNVTRNHNLVTKLAPGVLPFGQSSARVIAGYPLFSRWARPILSYTDANHDGIIEPDEVLVGDSLVYMGASEPDFQAGLSTSVSLFRGALTTSADFSYQAGLTQLNSTIATGGLLFSRGASDPHAPFGEQAAMAVLNLTDYGLYQTVNTFRFASLSVAYQVPAKIAHWLFRASSLSVALQGTNLALFTNYKGKDPDVNAFATGNQVQDVGVIPQPRIWRINVRASY